MKKEIALLQVKLALVEAIKTERDAMMFDQNLTAVTKGKKLKEYSTRMVEIMNPGHLRDDTPLTADEANILSFYEESEDFEDQHCKELPEEIPTLSADVFKVPKGPSDVKEKLEQFGRASIMVVSPKEPKEGDGE